MPDILTHILIFFALFLTLGTAAAQAGYSMTFFNNKLQAWQNKIPAGGKVPEIFIGIFFGTVALLGWDHAYGLVTQYLAANPITDVIGLFLAAGLFFLLFIFGAFVAYVGKESATVFYLPGNWNGWAKDSDGDGDIDEDDLRRSSMRPVNDFIAKILGVSLTGRWYPKIWAFTKGFLISIPIAGLCAPFMPFTRHIGIKLGEFMNKRFGHDINFYAEFVGDGLGYALGIMTFGFLVWH